jgi:peptide/nickel transport system ATP-binding protein
MRLLPGNGRIWGGRVELDGRDVLGLPESEMRGLRGGDIGMIFQEPGTSLNPVLTVGHQIGEALLRHAGLKGGAARAKAQALLTAVGIADPARRLDEYPFQMSGGMKQRVMIAMTLAGAPRVLLADEPTTALDVTVQAQILDLLRDLQRERGMAMLLITHDLGVVARVADRVAVMYAGELVETAPRAAFFASPKHPYTQKLFAALPDLSRRDGTLATIDGQVPALGAMPAGCRFAPRCPLVVARCRSESPEWTALADGQQVRCHRVGEVVGDEARAAGESASAEVAAPLLDVRGLKMHFPIRKGLFRRTVGHVRAVDDISFSVARGRTLALVGESGCGKTTAGKAILQLLTPTAGAIDFDGTDLTALRGEALRLSRARFQMVFQDPFSSLDPKCTVRQILLEGVEALHGRARLLADADRVPRLLAEVGLDAGAADRYPHEFSGGQRQRVAIARALAVEPDLIVCDEPTSALDVSVQAQILNLLRDLQAKRGLAYLFITHNFAVVEFLAHEVAVMYLGRIVERGPVADVLRAPRHPYTQALLSAVPSIADAGREIVRLPGETPSPASPPAGCHFHPRCAQAEARCRETYPAVIRIDGGIADAAGGRHEVRCHLAVKA